VHQLFIDFKKAHDSLRREVLYNILFEFGIPMKLVRLIKMCLSETCSRVRVGKHILGRSIHSIKKNAEDLVIASKEIGLEVNAEETKYMVMSQNQNAG
jgi:hypothetical protein